ncbi:MAG: PUA domain-containing protein, partial [Pseudomonadota bacterium]
DPMARAAPASSTSVPFGVSVAALQRFVDGARATHFAARGRAGEARKRWIAATLTPKGTLVLDAGAARAIGSAASLLPVGVVSVHGDFRRGDTVRLCDEGGVELGRGLIAYDADEARRISGRNSADIEAVLGYAGRPTLVHRDDLVLTGVPAANSAGRQRHG